ncbi:unnamed protein product [Chilo suppressalis]|uniref:DUF4806 domain-containing protein n=1 Tax=Chilo suppressalis TaxID=168631 RepID=A0ABN8LFQ9_CHISP|nr:unnamed protein product [Chilo suppressalis]
MPFKIVKTYENNKDKLFAVPSFWEDKNILKWPRKNEAKHIKNESTPEADWKQLKCVVKRRNIPSYETAEYVLKEMLNHTDTEDDTCTSKKPICEKPLRELNLNIIADEIVYPAASVSNNVVEMPTTSGSNDVTSEMPAATSVGMDNVYEYHFIQDNQSTTNQHQCCTTLVQNLEVQNVILSNQTQILNELKSIKNAQNIIIQKVALFSIQLDDAVSQITQATDSNIEVTSLNEIKSAPSNTAFYVKPVENIQQLYDLEKQLSESSFRQKMKTTYSVLCNGGKGIDCAYTLADILFSREFLCECTWSGGSRGDDSKVAWKSFKHILSFFGKWFIPGTKLTRLMRMQVFSRIS